MAIPTTSYFGLTGDNLIDATTNGYFWRLTPDRTVDFSVSNGFFGETWNNIIGVKNYMGSALDLFSNYSNIKFNFAGYFATPGFAASGGSEINLSVDGQNILFGSSSTWAIGLFPNSSYNASLYSGAPGDVYLNLNSLANYLPSYEPGSQGWFLLIHELGHTLGLKHPHDNGGTGRPTFSSLGLSSLDIDLATIMSYNDDGQWNMFSWDPATPMILDVYALQYLYGKNLATNSGNNTYRITNDGYYKTIWDASGSDTVDASLNTSGWKIFLPQKSMSTLVDTKAGYALQLSESNSLVPTTLDWLAGDFENATGSNFGDVISGNLFGNILNGKGGNDSLYGEYGRDTLIGGLDKDLLYGGLDSVRDVFDLNSVTESKVGSTNRDRIYNFKTSIDDVDLSTIDANTKVSGNQGFNFGGTTKKANGVWYEKYGSDLLVHADINGDRVSDMDIQLVGVSKLVSADFVL